MKDEKTLTEYQEELSFNDFNNKYMITDSEEEMNQSFQYEIDPLVNRQEFRKNCSKSFVKKENEIRLHRQSMIIEPKENSLKNKPESYLSLRMPLLIWGVASSKMFTLKLLPLTFP